MTTEVKGFKTRTGEKIIISPAPHLHTSDLISDLESTIASKILEEIEDLDFATSNHTHTINLITDLDLSGKVDKVTSATNGNLVEFGSNGILIDSKTKTSDFASSLHGHDTIDYSGDAHVSCDYDDEDGGKIELYVEDMGGEAASVEITKSNIDNFNRALTNPDTAPVNNSDKLVTSGGVYNALQDRPSRGEIGKTINSMLVLVKTSYHNACQGRRDNYDFQEYIETYTDAKGKLWTIYLWSDGGANYFMLDSPAEMQIGTTIYEYSVSAIAVIKANTASTITAALTSFVYDEVGNI